MNRNTTENNQNSTRKGKAVQTAEIPYLRDLVGKAQEGDVESFQQIYQLYGRKILNFLFRMSGSREEAEDLTQDTFVLAFRKIGSLKDPVKIQGWLFRIAQNCFYQKHRGRKPQMESIDEDEAQELSDVQKLATPGLSPEENVLSDELENLIQESIRDLPEKYRTVFVLSAVQKLSYQEISEILNRSLASVKSDIHRARVAVRDRIKEYLGENYGMSKLH